MVNIVSTILCMIYFLRERFDSLIILYVWAIQEKPPKGSSSNTTRGAEVPMRLIPLVISNKQFRTALKSLDAFSIAWGIRLSKLKSIM